MRPNRFPAVSRVLTVIAGIILLAPAGTPAARAEVPPVDWNAFPAYYEIDEWHLDWSPVHGLRVEAHRIVRVNRSSHADAGRIRIWDTFFQRLKSFKGTLSDTLGRVLYEVGQDEVRSVAPFSEFRLYSGDVIRAVDLVAPQPPYVIEARWTVEIDNPFFWPDWVLSDQLPRRRALYSVAVPKRKEIRYQQVASSLVRTIRKRPRREVIAWELRDWIPENPDGTPGSMEPIPLLRVAPLEFNVGRHRGRTDSWDALGRWYWLLTSDRLDLDDDQIEQVDRYLQDFVGLRAQAAGLKDWISDDWRYVAIEVGLGGWKPHPAKDVYDNHYGDCKDVVFLWVAMLRHLGITAYPALIRARNPSPVDPEFPKDWFDHVVGMAIIDGDTLWADLSDSRYRLGTLPPACEERWALVVGEFGGTLVRTPCRTATENLQSFHCQGTVDTDGNLEFEARMSSGGHYAQLLPLQRGGTPREAAAIILGVTPPAMEGALESINVTSSDQLVTKYRGRLVGWAIGGKRQMVVRPRFGGWMAADTLGGHSDPARAHFPQVIYDTLIIDFPPGWEPEYWPVATFQSDGAGEFGEVRSFEDGRLTVIRHLRWNACERSRSMRTNAARLRDAYRSAQNSEWVFRLAATSKPTDSAAGSGSDPGSHKTSPLFSPRESAIQNEGP